MLFHQVNLECLKLFQEIHPEEQWMTNLEGSEMAVFGQKVNWELEDKINQAVKNWEKEVTSQPVNDSTNAN